jgi:ribosomal protein S18 acetylase RimI-like enzyme
MTSKYTLLSEKGQIGFDHFSSILREIGELLPDPLSERVDVDAYAKRLYENAEIVVAQIETGEYVGVSAFYANDVETKKAYWSIMGVKKEYSGNGIGTSFIEKMFSVLEAREFESVVCHVHPSNTRAIKIYEKHGFSFYEPDDRGYFLKADVPRRRR